MKTIVSCSPTVKRKGFGFTLMFLQQTDVIQLTDGGERFSATLQLTAEVEVARPVPAHTPDTEIRKYKVTAKHQQQKNCRVQKN